MTTMLRIYEGLVTALAAVAGAVIVVATLLIVYDVMLRNFLISPPAFSAPSIEYGLLYVTMLAGPWLVRTQGHVVVEVLRQALPPSGRRVLEKIVYVACIAICGVLAWAALVLTIEAYGSGEVDPRAIEIPHTLRYGPMVVGFALMGVEFCRYLFGARSFYRESALEQEGGV